MYYWLFVMGNVCHRSGQSSAVFRCIDIILTQAETAGCQQELEDKIRNLLYTEAVLYMGNYFIRIILSVLIG